MNCDIFEFIYNKLNLLGENMWFLLVKFLTFFHFTTVSINLHSTAPLKLDEWHGIFIEVLLCFETSITFIQN